MKSVGADSVGVNGADAGGVPVELALGRREKRGDGPRAGARVGDVEGAARGRKCDAVGVLEIVGDKRDEAG